MKFSNKENLPIENQTAINPQEALQLSAETAAEFGFFENAVLFRENLQVLMPDDPTNKIELARLYEKTNNTEKAVSLLLETISNRNFDRKRRWQSLIVLAEAIGNDENSWRKIFDENRDLENRDSELWLALRAFSCAQKGQLDEAINLLQDNDFTVQLKFLKAIFEKNSGRDEAALKTFTELSGSDAQTIETFGFYEQSPVSQLILLYLKTSKVRAALDLATKQQILKTIAQNDLHFEDFENYKSKTIEVRSREMKLSENLQILEKLSIAAESVGDFSLSFDFEKAKSNFLISGDQYDISAKRLETLKQKLAQKAHDQTKPFLVNEKPVSEF